MDGAQEMESRRKKKISKKRQNEYLVETIYAKKEGEEQIVEEDRVVDSRIPNVSF